jgi:hypothetical protein
MERFWKGFWKFFGIALLAMLAAAVVFGIINHSSKITYTIAQGTFVAALGVCGLIALVIVPLELYLEDTRQRKHR